ncbi:glycerol kinase GlpK [Aliidiomarina maris]|uniref:glycerol kinase n=1 Tax=Aliidiomarina maris TaxID=531312 RepID=A0A327X1E4_9GAMM|nr:glycerol kinase GlpK [Aliidiomarina maris]MCL5049707.1 glycerol kinase GlpK [Bacillota bacterium]RAJ99074.1 glycerol kinase [Aliidiomarina maris]RUO27764.1 glycerol kinase [Aliidiomarina maris]
MVKASNPSYILAIDQGTTSSRAIIYLAQSGETPKLKPIASAAHEFKQHFPENGWVEHDPEDLWQTTLSSCEEALQQAELTAADLAGIGITNQRETTVVWDKQSGEAIYRAIVWQDRRTAAECRKLREAGHQTLVNERTGLLLDPYFSATKISWILDHVDGARARAEAGELCFGTVETYLLWRLTEGAVHATDASNASRTLLMNLAQREWDPELLALFNVPAAMLPEIRDNTAEFGCTTLLGDKVPVVAMVGDQQGALVGQACVSPGMLKSTYGTGCFALLNTGDEAILSNHRLLTTLAYQLDGKPTYALEGSIFMAGAIIQWLRDSLGILDNADESEALAEGVPYSQHEMLIPAFTGLGAPYWEPDARAAIFGMTRDTGRKQLAAAALKSVALQSHDLLTAMAEDGQAIKKLRVDGGMTANNWFMQALSDLTGHPVERAAYSEATAFGAAFLAALQVGIFNSIKDIQQLHKIDGEFNCELNHDQQQKIHQRWLAAIEKVR